ncbi:MAG TPA: ATP-binding protein [Bryobacteraceae bacterium]|nr:ATP-binding protein [Bryobacteraceae bacterium]
MKDHSPAAGRRITHASLLRVLIAGFSLVIVLLLAGAFIGIGNIHTIKENAARLVAEQQSTNRLLEEVHRQQANLSDVFSILARDPDSVDSGKILSQLDEAGRNIERIVAEGAQTPQRRLYDQLRNSSTAFSAEARRLLAPEEPETFSSQDLFRDHEAFTSVVAKLIEFSYRRALAAQNQIDIRSESLVKQSAAFLAAFLLMAVLSTVLTVRLTERLLRRMDWQESELSRVSWHMLEDQESTARRFSHELHDELGQSLTALKANLSSLGGDGAGDGAGDRARLEDCLRLVDESIGNVRQMSQLLHPTILDDFGLEAALRWLCEGFTHRTGIQTEFRGDTSGRLPDDTETHLFRLAQEALTNVARHSGARHAKVTLDSRDGEVCLSISDDGRGLPAAGAERGGMGMIGMRARARSVGGDLTLRSKEGQGVEIEVRVPAGSVQHERKDTHLVG